MQIKPKRRVKREKPEELMALESSNILWSMDFIANHLELDLFEALEEAQEIAPTDDGLNSNDSLTMGSGGITPAQKLEMAT